MVLREEEVARAQEGREMPPWSPRSGVPMRGQREVGCRPHGGVSSWFSWDMCVGANALVPPRTPTKAPMDDHHLGMLPLAALVSGAFSRGFTWCWACLGASEECLAGCCFWKLHMVTSRLFMAT